MKKITYLIWFFLFVLAFNTNAEYIIYTDKEEFEEAKWSICEQATDGCNTYILEDWKVTAWTEMYCKDHTSEWTCTKFKEWSISTMSIGNTTSEEPRICTKEYMPVCAKVQVQCIKAPCNPILQTFSNTCMAWDNEIVYNWTCDSKLSDSDISLYNSIKTDKLDNIYQWKIYDLLEEYKLLISKYSEDKQKELNSIVIERIEDYIFDMNSKYPQDKALPEDVLIRYLMLKLLILEIEML